ncbi:Essential protein Yae1, N terminal [Maudiozyma exigua]|uniref:Protein YAE1 n=1 Tax=Maudiozyma exigua TaxID=34358 RepID=A0A9P6W139_MAUEX|nr:Essential protein Yae1, N terminal [Kazachstania exigua]
MGNNEDVLDDVWGSDSDDEILNNENAGYSRDLQKLREQHNKRGYLDGIVSSKETNLQDGFNAGFPTGASIGFEVGKLIGIL